MTDDLPRSDPDDRDALRASDQLVRQATEMAGIAMWEFDVAGNVLRRTDNHESLLGRERQSPWRLESFLDMTSEEYRRRTTETINASLAPGGPDDYQIDVPITWPDGSTHWVWVRGRVVRRDEQGRGMVARGILARVDERKRLEIRGDYLARLYATLSECNNAVVVAQSETDLFQRLCSALVRFGHASAAWIGLATAGGTIEPVAWSGPDMGGFLVERARALQAGGGDSRDVAAIALAENRVVWRRASTALESDGMARVVHGRGWSSTEAIPIRRDEGPIGVLVAYAHDETNFGDEVERLLDEIAGDLAFGMRRLAVERDATRARDLADRDDLRRREVVRDLRAGLFEVRQGRFSHLDEEAAHLLGLATARESLGHHVVGGNAVRDALQTALSSLRGTTRRRTSFLVTETGVDDVALILVTLASGTRDDTFAGSIQPVDAVVSVA